MLIKKEEKVLLGKRKQHPFAWGFPGGKMNMGEKVEACALRELDEEVGIQVDNLRLFTVTNDIFPERDEHYVTLIFVADYASGEVVNKEPEQCEQWDWFAWNALPTPLSSPLLQLVEKNFLC